MMDIRLFVDRMKSMNLPQTVFVDCTSNESVASVYGDLIASNISVVTPNKLANAGPYRQYRKLHELVRKHHAKFLYETNVGAGLPVINTYKTCSRVVIVSVRSRRYCRVPFLYLQYLPGRHPIQRSCQASQGTGGIPNRTRESICPVPM